jgi:hypothetical protein
MIQANADLPRNLRLVLAEHFLPAAGTPSEIEFSAESKDSPRFLPYGGIYPIIGCCWPRATVFRRVAQLPHQPGHVLDPRI